MRRRFSILKAISIFCCAVIYLSLMSGLVHAESSGKLKVGVYESAPFAYKDELGKWNGIAVDLWQTVAKNKGLNFEFVEVDEKDAVIRLSAGSLDVIAAGLPVNLENEKLIDFSQPFFASDWSIAIMRKPVATIEGALGHVFFSWQFWVFVVCLALAFVLIAVLMWNFEVRENPDYSGPTKMHGISYGIYWAVAMMTGAGEKAPKTLQGRILAIGWLAAAFFLAGAFTASVTTVLNVEQLTRKISSERDLPHAYVAVAHGSCENLLDQMKARYVVGEDEKDCLQMLDKGQVEAVVGGEPFLKYYAAKGYQGKLDIITMDYDEVFYSIGLKPGSELTEEVNRGVLQVTSTHAWAEILQRYLKH